MQLTLNLQLDFYDLLHDISTLILVMHNGDRYRAYTEFSMGLNWLFIYKVDKCIFSQDEGTFFWSRALE